MRKTERDFSGTAERERDVRQPMADEKPRDAPTSRVSVDAYSLASQRRAIAYGRARGAHEVDSVQRVGFLRLLQRGGR